MEKGCIMNMIIGRSMPEFFRKGQSDFTFVVYKESEMTLK